MLKWIVYISFLFVPFLSKAETKLSYVNINGVESISDGRPPFKKLRKLQVKLSKAKHNRAVAAGLTIILGPFGVHRLYLGTSTKVPVIYSITFGGFFVLPLVDLGVILFTKDFERLKGDNRVIMWNKKNN